MGDLLNLPQSLLSPAHSTPAERRQRVMLFAAWLALVAWLLARHVLWRDEVRAFSLALSGSDIAEMLRNIHGEGHPALWYLILRTTYDMFPYREVLPVAGAVIGIAAMALFAFRAPFRLPIIALVLFSLFGAFEYVVLARNYGFSALVMFALAALYPRVKDTLWFGLILAILCNTNVPSCLLAAAFLLFRFAEMLTASERPAGRDWLVLGANAILALIGALLCFVTVYPPLNGGAVSSNFGGIGGGSLVDALLDGRKGFSNLVLNVGGLLPTILLWASCLAFIRRPPALIAALAALVGLKLFFYFVYPSAYRHEALFIVFLLSLHWMSSEALVGASPRTSWVRAVQAAGTLSFLLLLLAQPLDLVRPLYLQMTGVPYSRSADAGRILRDPQLSRAIVMADPDVMLEPLPYYAGNPLWFLREARFGPLFLRTRDDRRQISLDTILGDATRLHQRTGRPVVFLSHLQFQDARPERHMMMYGDATMLTPESVRRFRASTRLIARLRPAISDETYDLYVYPR